MDGCPEIRLLPAVPADLGPSAFHLIVENAVALRAAFSAKEPAAFFPQAAGFLLKLEEEFCPAFKKQLNRSYFLFLSRAMLSWARSLGDTPGMRPAWASVRGRIFANFSRASRVMVSREA